MGRHGIAATALFYSCQVPASAMFRGLSTISVDGKGRLAIPARYRDALAVSTRTYLVLTLNPWDRSLWLYPLPEWEFIETKLKELSDVDKHSRRTKQIMRGYATDCGCDAQSRVLLPQELRDIAGIEKRVAFLGQGNKFEIWDEGLWTAQRDDWLKNLDGDGPGSISLLESLSL